MEHFDGKTGVYIEEEGGKTIGELLMTNITLTKLNLSGNTLVLLLLLLLLLFLLL